MESTDSDEGHSDIVKKEPSSTANVVRRGEGKVAGLLARRNVRRGWRNEDLSRSSAANVMARRKLFKVTPNGAMCQLNRDEEIMWERMNMSERMARQHYLANHVNAQPVMMGASLFTNAHRSLIVDNAMTMSSVGPNSPLEIQSDGNSMMSSPNFSPRNGGDSNSPNMPQTSFTIGHGGYGASGSAQQRTPQYPPNHPLSGSKHLCSICGDRASGKHYGVYSCEGCKGFFKRTVRKDLVYACREERNCIIDKRQRNRCQYCRYQKCLSMGMKREAVQEERQRTKEKNENEVESTSNLHSDMSLDKILDAELRSDIKHSNLDSEKDSVFNICQVADKQLLHLVEWAKHIPHFIELPIADQVVLLRAGWNELLIASFSHRSTDFTDSIALAMGLVIHRSQANGAGVGAIFDRVLTELVAKMREMKMDRTELGCLRAIVLFNPEAKGLSSLNQVEALREKVYAALEEHCKIQYVDEQGRFAKLLLRLPALRSIGLKCLEHLFFFKLIGDTPIDTFLLEMLEAPCDP